MTLAELIEFCDENGVEMDDDLSFMDDNGEDFSIGAAVRIDTGELWLGESDTALREGLTLLFDGEIDWGDEEETEEVQSDPIPEPVALVELKKAIGSF